VPLGECLTVELELPPDAVAAAQVAHFKPVVQTNLVAVLLTRASARTQAEGEGELLLVEWQYRLGSAGGLCLKVR
jgi:hypothetical protein